MMRKPIQRKFFHKSISIAALATFVLPLNLLTAVSWSTVDTAPQIYHTILPSGQQVYVQEIHTQPIVTIDTWVNTGSAQEVPHDNGVSHFLEHLTFKGTLHHKPGEIDRILESHGAEFNAATSDDFTHFHITMPASFLPIAAKLQADMLMNASINPPELTHERKVVQEEINRSLDSPGRKAYIALDKLLFAGHPYAMDTLGPKYNIQTLPRQEILGYYHKWYQLKNFKTVVVGDVNHQQVAALIQKVFDQAYAEQTRPKAGIPHFEPVHPLTHPKSTVFSDPNIAAEEFELGFQAPSVKGRSENDALDIAASILGQGSSSRLYQDLKEKQQLVNEISVDNGTQRQAGVFAVYAAMKPKNREAAKKAILKELERFKAQGPTPAEMQKAKTQVIKDFAFLNESTGGVAESIGYSVTIGKLSDYSEYVNNIQKVTAQEVQAAAQKYLNFDKAAMVEEIPGAKDAGATQQEQQNIALLQNAAKVPVASSQNAMKTVQNTAQVSKVVLPDGATLLLKPSPTTQTVAIDIFAKGGRLAESKPGVPQLTSSLLLKGTKSRTEAQISDELGRLGLSLDASSDNDTFQITGTCVAGDFSKLLLILQDVLQNPTFSQSELDKTRADLIEALKTGRNQPSSLMFENMTHGLYPNHPYGAVGKTVEEALPSVTRQDVVSYYHKEMQPKNLVISVAGNFDPGLVKTSLQQIVEGLPVEEAFHAPKYQPVQPLSKNVTIIAHKPQQAATWVGYAWLAPAISTHKDYLTLKVINALLGSGLSSRLFVDLREKHGWAYQVSSMFPSSLEKGSFAMYIGTDPRNLENVQNGFEQEVTRLLTQPVSAQELQDAKNKLTGTFALAHESNANQAYYLGFYETMGVGYQFDKEYPQLVQQITPQDVQRVAKEIFGQPRVVSIVDPKEVIGQLNTHEN